MARNPSTSDQVTDVIRTDDQVDALRRERDTFPVKAHLMEGPITTDRYFPVVHMIDVGGPRRLHILVVCCRIGECTISFQVNDVEIASVVTGTKSSPAIVSLGDTMLDHLDYFEPVIQDPSGDCDGLSVSWAFVR